MRNPNLGKMLKFLILTALLAHSTLALTYARKGYTQPQQQQQQEEDNTYQEEEPTYEAPAKVAPTKTVGYQKPKLVPAPAPAKIPLAINSQRKIKYVEVASSGYAQEEPLTVEVPAATSQVNFILRSRSSPVNIDTYHEGSKGSYKETSSEDAPEVRVHTVTKPIYQEVREIIAPYRKIQQQIQPVQEIRESQVAKQGAAAPVYTQPKQPTYTQPKKPAYVQPKQPAYTQPKQQTTSYVQAKKPAAPVYAPKPKQAAYAKPKLVYTQPKQTYDQPQTGYAKPASPGYASRRRYADNY